MTTLEKIGIGFGSAALLGMAYQYFKVVVGWALGVFFVTQSCDDPGLNNLLTAYLGATSKSRYGWGERVHDDVSIYVKPLSRVARVIYYALNRSQTMFLWGPPGQRAWPLVVSAYCDSSASSAHNSKAHKYRYLRGTVDWVKMTKLACEYEHEIKQESAENRYRVYHHVGMRGQDQRLPGTAAEAPTDRQRGTDIRVLGWFPIHYTLDELGPEQSPSALDFLSLTPELQDLREEIQFWYDERDWYEERGISWRRGYLFEGRPGTGKTSYARALAEELDLPVHTFDLSSMDNGELNGHWSQMQRTTPCIALLEDIDAVFHMRKNVANKTLTFDCLLNCIDGIEKSDGTLLIVTTNYLERVDPALGGQDPDAQEGAMPSRPGRVDNVVHFQQLDDAGRRKMATRILADHPEEVEPLVVLGRQDSAAQFMERSFRVALDHKFRAYREQRRK